MVYRVQRHASCPSLQSSAWHAPSSLFRSKRITSALFITIPFHPPVVIRRPLEGRLLPPRRVLQHSRPLLSPTSTFLPLRPISNLLFHHCPLQTWPISLNLIARPTNLTSPAVRVTDACSYQGTHARARSQPFHHPQPRFHLSHHHPSSPSRFQSSLQRRACSYDSGSA